MNITELIRYRKSVRSWADRSVDRETVEKIVDAARFAPSAKNCQDWRIIAVTDGERRKQIAEIAGGQSFVGKAPVILAVCGDTSSGDMHCQIPRAVVDGSILLDHITLVAASEGLGTCWIGHFDQDACRDFLGLPEGWKVLQLMPLGYPADPDPVEKSRKGVGEILDWNTWGGSL